MVGMRRYKQNANRRMNNEEPRDAHNGLLATMLDYLFKTVSCVQSIKRLKSSRRVHHVLYVV